MKKKLLLLWAVFVAVLGFFQSRCQDSNSGHSYHVCAEDVQGHNVVGREDSGDAVTDVALVDFDDGLSHEEVLEIGRAEGLDFYLAKGEEQVDTNFYLVDVPEGHVPKLAVHLKAHYSDVESVQENYKFFAPEVPVDFGLLNYNANVWTPNDPLRQFQWHFDQIGTEEAWTLSTGRGSVVAVIDTGVALYDTDKTVAVRDLQGANVVEGYDFVEDNNVAYDLHGHGTHVAGTIAQVTHNKYGTSGVAYNSTIMPVRVLGQNGGTASAVARGIIFAADNGAHVINMSLGSSQKSEVIQDAIHYAREQGVTVIAAAGNGGKRQPNYPAASDGVISVASTQYDKHPAFYSQWGPSVDIAAPGGNTRLDQNKDGKPDGVLQETIVEGNAKKAQFSLYMGTSMAAPHVAGTAALINQWGVTHPDRVESYLKKGANQERLRQESGDEDEEKKKKGFVTTLDGEQKPDTYPASEFRERYGAGIVQADSAVTAAIIEPGLLRLALALIFGCLMFVLSRQVNLLEADLKLLGAYLTSAAVAACGFFFLPFVVPGMEHATVATIVQFASTPLMAWDWLIAGVSRFPVTASALIPCLIALALYGFNRLRYVGAGLATGFAAFLFSEAILLTSPLMFIPGGDIAARIFFGVNALVILVGMYFVLAKDVVLNNED